MQCGRTWARTHGTYQRWGASIDETLGEEVRVTVIATGYKVDGLPSEEAEEGKKTITEAIEDNYPPQPIKPLEDEKPQTLDLNDTLHIEQEINNQVKTERPLSPSADEIVIQVEEEMNEIQEKTNSSHSPFSWIRRK